MKTLLCDCNRTLPLDAPAVDRLRRAIAPTAPATEASADTLEGPYTLLCRREAAAFQRAAKATAAQAEPLLVACTQEARLFLELNDETAGTAPESVRPIRFFNLRETGGWSREAAQSLPKMAALIAQAQQRDPEPVASVGYRSAGRLLVIGGAEAARAASARLDDTLDVSLLIDRRGGSGDDTLPQTRSQAVHAGRLTALRGWLGAFEASWQADNPIDLDLCTRCNACVVACPEGAIDFGWQVDQARCTGHRDCVRACGAAGAIDFERAAQTVTETFDLVLDLRPQPAFTQHQPPQGYQHAGSDPQRLERAVHTLRGLVGEFEKPRFFRYAERLCAHSRNQQIGCTACIDVCSARAIRSDASLKGKRPASAPLPPLPAVPSDNSDVAAQRQARPQAQGGGVVVEPHLCVGCGACSTVCPSGAMRFAYPDAAHTGARLRTLLAAYARAGGRDAALLLHSQGAGSRLVDELGRATRVDRTLHGVPARVLPLALWHTASVGLELWLAALAWGASQVWVLLTDEEAPEYRAALSAQMALAQALLHGLGYQGEHFRLLSARDARDLAALDAALRVPPAQGVAVAAGFALPADKRGALELALEHLIAQASARPEAIALPPPSPFGSVLVDAGRCTLCLACVGACPAAALADNPDRPQLKFIEKNCVQCGLCASTCPERAITLQPRLWLADGGRARKSARLLHEVAPFACVRCGKPFGTAKAIEAMLGRLAGHAAFQGSAAERLKMCADCRVIDIHTQSHEVKITDL